MFIITYRKKDVQVKTIFVTHELHFCNFAIYQNLSQKYVQTVSETISIRSTKECNLYYISPVIHFTVTFQINSRWYIADYIADLVRIDTKKAYPMQPKPCRCGYYNQGLIT